MLDGELGNRNTVEVWLHFTISQQDLTSILSSSGFVKKDDFSLDFVNLRPPSWWKPASLAPGPVQYYELEHLPAGESEWRKILITGSTMREVYFVYFRYY
jgi:hypothetical protein